MKDNRDILIKLLQQKAALKQDIASDGEKAFLLLKKIIKEELESLNTKIKDKRIRLFCEDKGKFEIHVYVGSDVLVFHLHNNVFRLPDDDGMWNDPYFRDNENNAYFSLLYIYNFLAESLIQNRVSDLGYLIGRVMINKEQHFYTEGNGQLGVLFRNPAQMELNEESMRLIIQVSFAHAIGFDLLVPPYQLMSEMEVDQLNQISNDLQLKTGKRLGFKQKGEEDENF